MEVESRRSACCCWMEGCREWFGFLVNLSESGGGICGGLARDCERWGGIVIRGKGADVLRNGKWRL